jgi:four helix bundle protein
MEVEDGYEGLLVWQKAVELAVSVKKVTDSFPKSELFGSVSQMRRASASIAANIAEGYGRVGRGEYLKHLGYARGSAFELNTHMVIARKVGLLKDDVLEDQYRDVVRLLAGLIRSLEDGHVREDEPGYGDPPYSPKP